MYHGSISTCQKISHMKSIVMPQTNYLLRHSYSNINWPGSTINAWSWPSNCLSVICQHSLVKTKDLIKTRLKASGKIINFKLIFQIISKFFNCCHLLWHHHHKMMMKETLCVKPWVKYYCSKLTNLSTIYSENILINLRRKVSLGQFDDNFKHG